MTGRVDSIRSMGFLLVALLLGTPLLRGATPAEVAKLEELVRTYEKARADWLRWNASRQAPGRRRGQRKKNPPDLRPMLKAIGELGSPAALQYLAGELDRSPSRIASLAGLVLVQSENARAVQRVASVALSRAGDWPPGDLAPLLDALARSKNDTGVRAVVSLTQRGSPESRAIALGSLKHVEDPDIALGTIQAALGQRSLLVRGAALRAVRRFRDKSMVEMLFEHVGREPDPSLRAKTLQFLVRLTGVNMGFEVEDWRKWWAVHGDRFEFEKESRGKTAAGTTDLEYFGIEIASDRIAFLVDASKSMERRVGRRGGKKNSGKKPDRGARKRRIDLLKEELSGILERLPAATEVNILYFHRAPFAWKEKLQPLGDAARRDAIRFVQELTCELKTNIYDTLELALEDRRVDTIYLLSDGQPVGGKYTEPDDIVREITAINRIRGATIHCISFGNRSAFLQELADKNDGVYRLVR